MDHIEDKGKTAASQPKEELKEEPEEEFKVEEDRPKEPKRSLLFDETRPALEAEQLPMNTSVASPT